MTISADEAEKYAAELVRLTIDANQTKDRIKSLKDAILEFADVEQLSEKIWQCDNGYVELKIETKYKLNQEIPATVEIDEKVIEKNKADEAIKTTFKLTKEGKKMLAEGDVNIASLMVANEKIKLDVIV
jgi:hypothetical protein